MVSKRVPGLDLFHRACFNYSVKCIFLASQLGLKAASRLKHPAETLGPTDRNLVFCAPACTWRRAGEGELVFALIHSGPISPDLAEGANREVLPVFWRVWLNPNPVSRFKGPNGQVMRAKRRGSSVAVLAAAGPEPAARPRTFSEMGPAFPGRATQGPSPGKVLRFHQRS
jgi:hypothetical protein